MNDLAYHEISNEYIFFLFFPDKALIHCLYCGYLYILISLDYPL